MTLVQVLATGITATADVATPFANRTYPLPSGTQTGDLLIACYGGKPYDTTPSTPTDWTAQSGGANGTTGMGAGTGSVYAVAFTKVHDGSESDPTSTFSAQYSPAVRAVIALRDVDSTSWTVTSCKGSDTDGSGTSFSATGDATLSYSAGDTAVVLLVHNDDSSSDSAFGLTITGCTVGTVTQRLTGTLTTSTGNDARMYVLTAPITAGAATAAPVVTATTGSGDSDGQAVFLCCRSGTKALRGKQRLTANQQDGTDTSSNTTGWSPDSQTTIASSTAYARTGSRSLELTAINAYDVGVYSAEPYYPVTPGDTVAVSGWTRKAAAVTAGHGLWSYINVYWFKDDRTASSTAYDSIATIEATDTWQQASASLTVPSDARWAQLYVVNQNTISVGDKFYWDDLSLLASAADVTGSVTLGGSAAWQAPPAAGSITLGGSAEAEDGSGSAPAEADGNLTLGGSASAKATATAAGSVIFGGSATAGASGAATGSLVMGGSAAAGVTATASGSVSLGGSAGWQAPPAGGGLTVGGTATAQASAAASGALTLGGSSAASAAGAASGSLTLGGASDWQAPPAAGVLELGAVATAQAEVTATGGITLSGGITLEESPTAIGSLALGGTAGATAAAAAAGSLTLAGSATAKAPATAAGSLTLSATTGAAAPATTTGALTLSASATGSASPTASGSLTLDATANATAPATATGSLTLSGEAAAQEAGPTAAGSLTLGGTADWQAPPASGSLTLGGTAAASAAGSLLATVSLSGLVDAAAAVATQGLIDLIGDATATATPTASGLLDLSGDVEVATLPGIMQQASAAVATLTAVRVIAPTVLGIDAAAPALAPASAVTATMTGTTTTTATIERS